jgi:hypothetical protein
VLASSPFTPTATDTTQANLLCSDSAARALTATGRLQ